MLRFPAGRGDEFVEHSDELISGARPERSHRQSLAGELVHDIEKPDLASVGGDIDLEIQRPHPIRPRRTQPLMSTRTDPSLLTHPDRSFQPVLTPQPAGAFPVDHQPLGPTQSVSFAPSPPRMRS